MIAIARHRPRMYHIYLQLFTYLDVVDEFHPLSREDLEQDAPSAQQERKHNRHQAVAHLSPVQSSPHRRRERDRK